jgi:hypothetical protein
MRVSVIVPTLNEETHILDTIQSLQILRRRRFDHPGRYGGLPAFSSVCTRTRKSTVYGLNGHRLYYIISLFKVTYESTIQVSRNFHALFAKTLEKL